MLKIDYLLIVVGNKPRRRRIAWMGNMRIPHKVWPIIIILCVANIGRIPSTCEHHWVSRLRARNDVELPIAHHSCPPVLAAAIWDVGKRPVIMTSLGGTMWSSSDYLHPTFTSFLASLRIQTIVELGGRYGYDAIVLRNFYGAKVHTFECNPDILPRCRALLSGKSDITLVERAAWDEDKPIPFYPVVETIDNERRVDNPGASSCFLARSDYLQLYKQKKTTVPAIRLDSYCKSQGIEQIDLLCIDIQGAALKALLGLGTMLQNTRFIIAELETKPIYISQHLFDEVDQFLQSQGFNQIAQVYRDAWFSDYMYKHKR